MWSGQNQKMEEIHSQKLKFLHIPYSGGRSSAVLVAQMQLLTLCQPLAQHLQHSVISTMLVGYKLQLRFIGEVILASLGKILSKPREKQHQCVDFPSLGRFFWLKMIQTSCLTIASLFHFISFRFRNLVQAIKFAIFWCKIPADR